MAAVGTLVLLLALVVVVYRPGLGGPFQFDDFSNIIRNPDLLGYVAGQRSLAEVLAGADAGPTGRPIPVLSLAWQLRLYGPAPWPFKLFNLIVHVVNTGLAWWLARQLAQLAGLARVDRWAWCAAAAWALHPLALSPVLYVVQRMASLAALGTLLALNCAIAGRQALASGRQAWPWLLVGFPCAVLFAVASKESGALLPAFLAVLELSVFPLRALPASARARWRTFSLVTCWIPLALGALALLLLAPRLVMGYANRDFTVGERLLTEPRVIWTYLRLLVAPSLQALGIFHDDLPLSESLIDPWTTLPALLGLGLLTAAAWRLRRRAPWFAFGVGFFLASQLLESSLIALEIMHEHRAYLGILGPVIAMVMGVASFAERVGASQAPSRASWLLAVPLLLLTLLTWQRAVDWSNPMVFAQLEAAHHPHSVRAQYDLADLYDTLASRTLDLHERARLLGLSLASVRAAQAAAPQDSKPWLANLLICSQADAGCVAPPDAWLRLDQALQRKHGAHLMLADVQSLVECAASGDCRFPAGAVAASLAAIAANPQFDPKDRAFLANLQAKLDRIPVAPAVPAPGGRLQP